MPTFIDQLIGNPTVAAFAPNANVQQQMQNDYAIEHLAFRLTGQAILASYTTAPAKNVESLENLIANFSLSATGKGAGATNDQVCSVDAAFLRFKTRLMEGTDVTRTDIGTANGTYAFETNFKKYFVDPKSDRGFLTIMYTQLLSSLTAAFQFRDASALTTGGAGGTTTLSGVQVTAQARMWLGLPIINPSPYVKETQRTFNVGQSVNGFRADKVPVSNVLRRQYFKGMLGATNYADPSDSVFGATGRPEGPHISLVINNNRTMLDQVYQQLRADNKTAFKQESLPVGYAVYNPARNNALKGSVPLKNVGNADNYLDVSYTGGSLNTIQITDEQIIGLSAAQFAS